MGGTGLAPSEGNTNRHAKEKREDTHRTVYFILKIQVFVLFGGHVSVIRRGGYRGIIALCT